jgi:hypothetical protein
MVLELGDERDVARAEVPETPGVGDQVYCLRHVPGEDDLPALRGIDQRPHLLSRLLETGRGLLGQLVHGSVDVRVRPLIELAHGVEHLRRLLR